MPDFKIFYDIKKTIKPYVYALRLVWSSSEKWTIARFVLILGQSFLPLVSLYLMKIILDKVVNEELLSTGNFDKILVYLLLFGFSLLAIGLVNLLSQLVTETQQQLVSDYMSESVQKKALELDLSYYENPNYQNTYFQAQKEALFRPIQIVSSLMNFFQHGASLILIAGFLTVLHYGVAMVLIISILPVIVIRYRFSKKLFEWIKNRVAVEREAHYINRLITSEEYVKEMRVFSAGKALVSTFRTIRKKLYYEKLRINKLRTTAGMLAKAVEVGAEVAIYTYITYRAFQGLITVGDLVIYFQAFQKGKSNLTTTLESLVKLRENRMFLSYIADFMNFKPLIREPTDPQSIPENIQQGIQIQNVSFRYPDHKELVLDNVSLNLKKGQITAIVGENGSGKSTLVKLLCRLYDPAEGRVLLDGYDIKEYSSKEFQKKMTVVFQDFAHYHFTVRENINLGVSHENIDLNRIQQVAKVTGADLFIDEFPDKYDQKLGRIFDGGRELSIGQWQKIALSRAFYKDSEIIVVDEPTSAIDPLAEYKIFDFLGELSKDKIVVLITHRLYNLKMCDQIAVLNKGKIQEVGSHADLIASNGYYCKMLEKQLSK